MSQIVVKQHTTPLDHPIDTDINLYDFLTDRVKRLPDTSLIEYKQEGAWRKLTATEFERIVRKLAKGLMAHGVEIGERVSIFSHTRWEWVALDMALLAVGAVVVPVYETNAPAQIQYIFNDSSVKIAFAETSEMRGEIDEVRAAIPSLDEVFVIDDGALAALAEFGRAVTDEEFEARERQTHGDALATIVYTSGSTGNPKGVELTHANFAFLCRSGLQYMPRACNIPDRRLLMFLPMSHVFARYMEILSFAGTIQLGLSSDFSTIVQDFHDFGPTLLMSVPRVFEKVYNAASQRAGKGFAGRMFADSTRVARQWSHAEQEGRRLPLGKRLKHAFYDRAIYSKIREIFGQNADFCITGGAPMDPQLAHYFNGIGIPLLEGYGMTETSGPVCVSLPQNNRIGTVGTPLSGVTIGIAPDGEILVKAPDVCRAYLNRPDATAETIIDGWLHTGDVGDIDDDGFVHLTDRKKELIITAGGINVAPGPLSASIMTSPVVDQALVIGDHRRFVSALVTLDLGDANAWLKARGAQPCADLAEAAKNPIIRAEVQRAVDRANETVSRAESIRKFKILPDSFTLENGMLTPSLKTRRKQIEERYADIIDTALYAPKKKKK